jgi:cardiolipin hydrolase
MFFPSDQSEEKLIRWLNKATSTMVVCVFTITNNKLVAAIRRAHDRGVAARVISDDECLKMSGSDVYDMQSWGIPSRSDADPHSHMHNKFVVIDDRILITGSFNWTM